MNKVAKKKKKKNTGVRSHSLLQGDHIGSGIKPGSPALQVNSYVSK